jgi:hypothetical protein
MVVARVSRVLWKMWWLLRWLSWRLRSRPAWQVLVQVRTLMLALTLVLALALVLVLLRWQSVRLLYLELFVIVNKEVHTRSGALALPGLRRRCHGLGCGIAQVRRGLVFCV